MAKVVWTAEAERWLRDIHDYIAEDNPPAAARVIAGIVQKENICRFSKGWPLLSDGTRGRNQNPPLWALPDCLSLGHREGCCDFGCFSWSTGYRAVFALIQGFVSGFFRDFRGRSRFCDK